MTQFYYDKYYSRKGSDTRFYIPLTSAKVDVARLKKEISAIVKPTMNRGYDLTTSIKFVNDDPPNFSQYSKISRFNSAGERTYSSGERDEDITFWPKALQGSYIQELSYVFSEMLQVKNPRARMSLGNSIAFHSDPHTPYRIHIALITQPDVLWNFRGRDKNICEIHQPADGIPVLIETGMTEHAVVTPANASRMHLWYQFHDIISDDILKKF